MYETMTFDYILQRMLDRVSDDIDKREGSIIYDALAPAAAELAQTYIELEVLQLLTFTDTTGGEYLSRRTAEFGVNRNVATAAVRKGLFYGADNHAMNIPIGSRYAIGNLTYVTSQQISIGAYQMICENTGTVGNELFGSILPIDYVDGLARAELTEILVPGENEETDEALRARLYETVNEPAFGGNVSDYKNKVNAIPGVGATKVYPVWQGGGTVKCTIIASDWSVPSTTLVNDVQTIIDPTVNSGQGLGQVPIDHKVTIAGVTSSTINITTTLALATGVTIGQVQAEIESVISSYLLELRKEWSNQQQIIVRLAQIDARVLTVPSVDDVSDTMINGTASNATLGNDEIPIFGAVVINV